MGGKKRLTLKQMERMQARRQERRESASKRFTEKKAAGIVSPDYRSQKVIGELKKMKVLTPYTVASRFDLRLSVAKSFLKELEKRGVIEYVSGSANLKIYKPSD
ncbi:MAG: hypothetical protein ACE5OW_06335 [Candidatus Bathyarchaeia archaeon]